MGRECLLDKIKVLVVDDSVVYRRIIAGAVEKTGSGQLDCTASNGEIALERLEQRSIDVVLLDVFMPGMDGMETLKQIKKKYPQLPVIMISGGGEDSAKITVEALEKGAMDFILKPSKGDPDENERLISRHLDIIFSQIRVDQYTAQVKKTIKDRKKEVNQQRENSINQREGQDVSKRWEPMGLNGVDVIVIASSTGGPNAVEQVCTKLPWGFSKPILIVQHMPAEFTRIFSEFLAKKCNLPVKETKDGDEIQGGHIFIAPGGYHLTVYKDMSRGKKITKLQTTPPVKGVRPAADVLFASIAQAYRGQRILAIILTGMGSDGTQGVATLKELCQCYCITQSQESCVIYGMPRSVDEAGLSDETVDLKDIGQRIIEIVSGRG